MPTLRRLVIAFIIAALSSGSIFEAEAQPTRTATKAAEVITVIIKGLGKAAKNPGPGGRRPPLSYDPVPIRPNPDTPRPCIGVSCGPASDEALALKQITRSPFLTAGQSATARLVEAIQTFEASLEVLTPERFPLEWATAQMSRGGALTILGQRDCGTPCIEEAVGAFRASLEVVQKAGALHYVYIARRNLAYADALLAEARLAPQGAAQ